jgi:hypothetical protein
MTNKIDEIADQVMHWFGSADGELQLEFQSTRFNDLHRFHQTLGQDIRNEFRLWEQHWQPDLVGGVDMSPDHPDALSMKVIEEVWRRVQ